MTPQEYITLEDATPYKNEYYDGAMLAMVDRTHANAVINGNLCGMLHERLRDTHWSVMSSAMRVLIEPLTIYTYPDASVSLWPVETLPNSDTTMINPCLIAEVLAPSGENYARRAGFQHFQQIAAMQDYLVISQECCHIGHYSRVPNAPSVRWIYTAYVGVDSILKVPSLSVELPLCEVYKRVKFSSPGSTTSKKHPLHDRIF